MSLDRLLVSYAARGRIDEIPEAPDGSRVLVFDGRLKVRLRSEGADNAIAFAKIGDLPTDEQPRRERVDRLLSAATGRMRRGAEIVSLAEDGRGVMLHRRFPVDLPPHAFDAVLTGFVNALAFWQRHLADAPSRRAAPFPLHAMPR